MPIYHLPGKFPSNIPISFQLSVLFEVRYKLEISDSELLRISSPISTNKCFT